jgi:hypothetical protein
VAYPPARHHVTACRRAVININCYRPGSLTRTIRANRPTK